MSFSDDILAKRGTWQLFKTVGGYDLSLARSGHIDRQGCLWLRLADTVLCTDGHHVIRHYTTLELTGQMESMAGFCRNDNYWWITQDFKLKVLSLNDGMVEDHTGNVPSLRDAYWLWTSRHEDILIGSQGALIRYNGRSATVLDVPANKAGKIHFATLSPDGDLWLTAHDGLYFLDEQGFRMHQFRDPATPAFWDIIAGSEKTIWFTGGRRLIYLEHGQPRNVKGNDVDFSVSFKPLLIDDDGNAWVAMHFRGTLVIGKSGMVLFPFEDTPGLSWPKCVVQDKAGAYWFIGVGNGIIRYDPHRLNIVRRGYLEAAAMGHDGKLLVTAASKGLLEYDGSTIRQLCEKVPPRSFSMSLQPNSDIYIASPNGVFIFDVSQSSLRSPQDVPGMAHIPSECSVHSTARDVDGCLWLNLPKILYRCEPGGVRTYPHATLGLPHCVYMFQDSANRLWFFGGADNPVMRFDVNGFSTHCDSLDKGTGGDGRWYVNCCAEGHDGGLWIGSTMGHLGRLCPQSGIFELELKLEGGAAIRHVRFSDDGQIWMSTINGLFIYDGTNTYRMTEASLLPSRRIVATFSIKDGMTLIVTELGLCEYRPTRTVRPSVFIDRIVADQTYANPGRHVFCESRPELVIFLTAVNMKPGPLQYQIRMSGIHDHWTDSLQEEFHFTDLPVGRYTFEARAIDQDLVTSADPAVVVIDITPDSRQTHIEELEGELHGAEDFADNIIRSMSEAIIVLHIDGLIATVNAAALRIFGYSQADLVGKSAERLFSENGVCPIDSVGIERLRHDGSLPARELDMQTRDGAGIPVIFSASCMHDRNGGLQGFVLTASDISEYKLMQSQMLHSQKMESLGVLAGGIAHDFNNLLGIMVGNADLMLFGLDRSSTHFQYVSDIVAAGRQAAKLCAEMLAYSGKGQLIRAPLDLSAIVQQNADLLKSSTSRKIAMASNLDANLPMVWGDEAQLMQIVLNLVINAADAIGDNTGLISLSTCSQALTGNSEFMQGFCGARPAPGMYVRLEVKDSGCGMDQETLSRIFEPFFTTKFTGRGLGLSAIHGIVKSHGGTISVDSQPGVGTTFQVFLPVYEGRRPSSPSTRENEVDIKPGLALIVDDEPAVRTITRRMLEHNGFACIEAVDGLDGLETLEQNKDRVDLVLLDITMPRMEGLEAYGKMRQMRPDLPIVILSGYSENDMADRFPSDKRLKLMHKPFTLKAFSSAIADAMR